jgi:hypothetical protein
VIGLTLCTPGHCHCVPCRRRLWWGVCRSRVATALCRTRLVVSHSTPLCSRQPCRLSIFALVPILDSPSFFSFGAPLLARLLVERTLSPPFSFAPLKLAQGARHGRRSPPPRDPPLVIPLYAASTSGALHHHLRPPSFYNATLLASPPFHPQIRSRACRINHLCPFLGGRSSRSSQEESGWRQSYEIQPLLADLGSLVRGDGVTREEGIWFSSKKFKIYLWLVRF